MKFTVHREGVLCQQQTVEAESRFEAVQIAIAADAWSVGELDFDPEQDVWADRA